MFEVCNEEVDLPKEKVKPQRSQDDCKGTKLESVQDLTPSVIIVMLNA